MKRTFYSMYIIFLLISTVSLFSQINPPPGSSVLLDLYSPHFLAGGLNSAGEVSPAVDALNPAASGAKQRFTMDLSYLALIGSTEADAGFGHVVNTGVTVPTRAGVISGSARFITSPFTGLQLSTFGALNISFAKDLFPKLLVGAGLQSFFGSDWGLGLDIGFVHLPGDIGFLKDFRWGVAFKGLGKGFVPVTDYTSFPETFTPSVGAHFGLIDIKSLQWDFSGNLSFPSFQNIRFALGTELTILNFISLHASSSFDLRELVIEDQASRSLPLSFGLSVGFATSIRKDKSEVKTTLAAAPLHNGIWAIGAGVNIPVGVIDKKPPIITFDTSTEYISPNLDGIQDDLTRSIEITDERFIKGYRFIIEDSSGSRIREIVNKDERPENVTVKNVFARLVYVKTGITIPEKLRWDGRSDKGSIASDGTYTYRMEAWDDNGNIGKSETGTVVVDNTFPSIEINSAYTVFSPNEDGNKDTLPIDQIGSEEILWQGVVKDVEDAEIRQFKWENSEPESFQWDGKNGEGILAQDGVYSYIISTTDKAGNSSSARIDNILINTQATPINISISESFFSPNGDGAKDSLSFNLDIPITSGIEKWNLAIIGKQGNSVKVFKGDKTIPENILFNGEDDAGKILTEGLYKGKLDVLYISGNNPTAESPPFTIDLTPPSASVSADLAIFSPNGDGIKDLVTIYQETSDEILWKGTVKDLDGREINVLTWRGMADAKIQWAGRAADGSLVPDGIYFYTLESVDKAGNSGESKKIRFELNTQETAVFLSTDLSHFSPNADGVKDRIIIHPNLKVASGVDSFELNIKNTDGQVIRTIRGQNRAPEDFAWDGLDNKGRRVPDGVYRTELKLDYLKGDHHEVFTPDFSVDTKPPQINISADYTLFSPEGDGQKDVLPIKQSSSSENLWEAEFSDASGEIVRSLFWKEKATNFNWDGKDENGNKIPDGRYTYRIKSTDRAGNSTESRITGIEIDTRLTSAFLTVSADGLSPNGDGFRDSIEFKTYVGLSEGINSWKLDLVNTEYGVQKTFSGKGASVPSIISWNGEDAREGNYKAVFAIEYNKGNKPEAQSTPFVLDVSPPDVAFDIFPKPFSPDNDGVDDELSIGIKVQDISPILDWSMEINDPMGNMFYSFTGRGHPTERIIWDGLSDWGELVQAAEDYMMEFKARDRLGNVVNLEEIIPVDVLVIRDGDKLKIRISSITFPANSPDLSAVEDEVKVLKNIKTLKRLAEILIKYNTYYIRIEGHANNLSWQDKEKAAEEEIEELAPLSLSRAEAVKAALVGYGLQSSRISTEGLGGKNPIVPFSDTVNRWKNRRVEFILIKK